MEILSGAGGRKMNKVILVGRLTKEPDIRFAQTGNGQMEIVRYTLAVERRQKKEGGPSADFIPCICFGKSAEFAEKYFHKGMKIGITGRIQTGNYEGKDGKKVYTTDVIIDEQEFCESKKDSEEARTARDAADLENYGPAAAAPPDPDGFMQIPEGIEDELPFN